MQIIMTAAEFKAIFSVRRGKRLKATRHHGEYGNLKIVLGEGSTRNNGNGNGNGFRN